MPVIFGMVLEMRVCRARAEWPGIVRELCETCSRNVLEPLPPGPGLRHRGPGPGGRGSSTWLAHLPCISRTIPGHPARARQTRIPNTILEISGISPGHPARAGQIRISSTFPTHGWHISCTFSHIPHAGTPAAFLAHFSNMSRPFPAYPPCQHSLHTSNKFLKHFSHISQTIPGHPARARHARSSSTCRAHFWHTPGPSRPCRATPHFQHISGTHFSHISSAPVPGKTQTSSTFPALTQHASHAFPAHF